MWILCADRKNESVGCKIIVFIIIKTNEIIKSMVLNLN